MAPPTSSNDEKKGEERDGDREGSLGIGHGEDGVSCLIVQEFNAKEAGGSSSEQSGAFEASRQIVPPLPPQLMVVSLPSSNNEMKGEKKEGDREESQGTGHGTDDVTGSIVEKFNIKEAGGSSSDMLSGGMEQFSLSSKFQFTWLFVFLPCFFCCLLKLFNYSIIFKFILLLLSC